MSVTCNQESCPLGAPSLRLPMQRKPAPLPSRPARAWDGASCRGEGRRWGVNPLHSPGPVGLAPAPPLPGAPSSRPQAALQRLIRGYPPRAPAALGGAQISRPGRRGGTGRGLIIRQHRGRREGARRRLGNPQAKPRRRWLRITAHRHRARSPGPPYMSPRNAECGEGIAPKPRPLPFPAQPLGSCARFSAPFTSRIT